MLIQEEACLNLRESSIIKALDAFRVLALGADMDFFKSKITGEKKDIHGLALV